MRYEPQTLGQHLHYLFIYSPGDTSTLKGAVDCYHTIQLATLAFLYKLRAILSSRSHDLGEIRERLPFLFGGFTVVYYEHISV